MIHQIVAAACTQQPRAPEAPASGWRAPDHWELCHGCGAEMTPPDTLCDECLEDHARLKARETARQTSWRVRLWRWLGLRD